MSGNGARTRDPVSGKGATVAMIDEGYIKFESHWRKTAPLEYQEIEDLIRWRQPLFEAGLIGQYSEPAIGYGNLSMRLAADAAVQFIITATQTGHLPALGRQHFALVTACDLAHNRLYCAGAAQASSESMTHAAIYQLDQSFRAVVHVHSKTLWLRLKDKIATTSAAVAYGTPEMALEFRHLFDASDFSKSGVAVMAGHEEGLIATGPSMQEATEKILALHAEFG
jgi:hypothetical protein